MANSTRKRGKSNRSHQAAKPYPEFPLTAHASGRWCKKLQGRRFYFGKVDDGWEPAFAKYERDWPHILEHGEPRPDDPQVTPGDGCTMAGLCNEFLNSKRRAMEGDELSPRSFEDYRKTTDRLITEYGRHKRVEEMSPSDFERFRSKLAKRYGTVSLKNIIGRCRVVFKYASDNRLIDAPVHYGQAFNKPSASSNKKLSACTRSQSSKPARRKRSTNG